MYKKISLNGARNVHFIGIGGISMSGFAEILKREGFNVSGSDDNSTDITTRLKNLGITVSIPTSADNIRDDVDLVVYTAAIKPTNVEYNAAYIKGKHLMERAEFVGKILPAYENAICIAGTHGKTTTTSMVSEVLISAGLDPTISIGGHMNRGGMNYRVGESSYFVLEACEYSNSFHHWHPQVGVILNMEADHLDFFGSMENVTASFAKFARNIRQGGTLVIGHDIPQLENLVHGFECNILTFGLTNGNFKASGVKHSNEKTSFDVIYNEKTIAHIDLPMPGDYNILNALATFAVAYALDVPPQEIAAALSNVMGIKRRFEYKGSYNGIDIVDDYAHHPTEIRACLAAAREKFDGKIVCIFQPHTYSRTKSLFREFAESFNDADEIIIAPIFAAREPSDPTITPKMLADEIKSLGKNAMDIENFDKAGKYLRETLIPHSLLITMGAGDIYKVGESLLIL